MDRTADKSLEDEFKASDVEACRICLATDIKLNSLQDTHLGSCLKSIGGFDKSYEGLPNYVCYECAPILIKCDKLITKSKTAQTTLLDIFNKNGQINKQLIEEQTKSNPNLQSSLDCYLLQTYYHIQHDEESNTSNFIQTESDPNKKVKLEFKKEIKDELSVEMSDLEILDMFKHWKEEGNDSESDVEAVEVPNPVLEISSDDEKMGDDFVSLKTYSVRGDVKRVEGLLAYVDNVPRNHRLKKRIGLQKRGKKQKVKVHRGKGNPNDYGDSFVRRYFSINHKPTRTNKKYSCKSCYMACNYMADARDHIIIGCQRSPRHRAESSASALLDTNSARSNQPNHWKEWPGSSQ